MGSAHPPLEHLLTSSIVSLESFELSRLNAVANLRKEFRQIVDEWIEAEIEARLSRWILDRRREAAADPQLTVPPLSAQTAQTLQAGAAAEIQSHGQAALPQQTASANSPHWQQTAHTENSSVDAQRIQQLALRVETTDSSDPAAAAQSEHAAPAEEGAADALRWLERFARNQGESLHSRLSALAELQAGSSCSADGQPVLPPIQSSAAQSLAAQPSPEDAGAYAAFAIPNQNDRPALVDPPRGEGAVAPRPPMRQIPLFRSRVAKAS